MLIVLIEARIIPRMLFNITLLRIFLLQLILELCDDLILHLDHLLLLFLILLEAEEVLLFLLVLLLHLGDFVLEHHLYLLDRLDLPLVLERRTPVEVRRHVRAQ